MRNITARENCDNFNKLLISNLKVEALDICFMNGETSSVVQPDSDLFPCFTAGFKWSAFSENLYYSYLIILSTIWCV